jgi:uncharacterized protein YxjI
MRLQINKRVFSLSDRYDILDDQGSPIFQVQSRLFSIGDKLDLLDMTGREVAKIRQRVFSFVSEYDILQDDQVVAVVKKQVFSLFHPRFTVEGPGGAYEMEGDWLNWNYEIRSNGQTVAQIGQQFALFQDRYGMEIADGADVPMLICLAIIIDEVSHPKN